jgi:hypothetical protein
MIRAPRLRADGVLALWRARAAERRLDPGSVDPLAVMRVADVARCGLFDPAAVGIILDALEGEARRRRERWQIRQLSEGVALVHDPLGARPRHDVPADLRHLADLERQAVILADVERALRTEPGVTLERLAVRWAVGVRTLERWRADAGCQSRTDLAGFTPESSETLTAWQAS